MKLLQTKRVQIRVNELESETYVATKGKTKSLTVYDTTAEEVWQVVHDAIMKKCKEDEGET